MRRNGSPRHRPSVRDSGSLEYQSVAQPGGFSVENPRHGVSAELTPAGVAFRAGENRWGMSLRGFGYGGSLHTAKATAPASQSNRVEYRRSGLTEWYENGPLGLEQGFTLAHAPGCVGGCMIQPTPVLIWRQR